MRASTKHPEREKMVTFENFSGGLNKDQSATSLHADELSVCKNMKYFVKKDGSGVGVKTRQGTTRISTTALPSAMKACTYYKDGSQYIVATSAKAYRLASGVTPTEIGTISGTPTFTEFKEKLIIHDGGVTKAWNANAFESLNCLYQDVVIGTGNGSTVNFTGTLANPAIAPNTVVITFTDGTTKNINDNGSGALTGAVTTGTNTITYTTGAYSFTCDGAPDDTTSITITYEKAAGAPKSKAGLVRGSRLYMWGDSDHPSRLWWSGVNDEDAWDTTSDGGYLDVDPDDGDALIGVLNYFQSLVLIKQNSLHRLDGFPGDDVFQVEPLMNGVGGTAYRTCLNDGNIVSFLSDNAWLAMTPSERYGDIQKTVALSKMFQKDAAQYAGANAYSEYNQIDDQLWLTLSSDIYVINLATGGQLSIYSFAFTHSCYKYVNGMMLIGGSDGYLYKLVDDNSVFKDNGVSYDCSIRGSFNNLGLPFNKKHNKRIYLKIAGDRGVSGYFRLYKNQDYGSFLTNTLSIETMGNVLVRELTDYVKDLTWTVGTVSESDILLREKFNYRELMFGFDNLYGSKGVEVQSVSFLSAIIGG